MNKKLIIKITAIFSLIIGLTAYITGMILAFLGYFWFITGLVLVCGIFMAVISSLLFAYPHEEMIQNERLDALEMRANQIFNKAEKILKESKQEIISKIVEEVFKNE